ncbi:hypothetical protein [Haemophilus haemolyticus]|uniref:hypothetical protein n=1 Tax=Haemophilus haemolyticus TaxID=726 RepID=UPI000E5742C6|nr:hypothetical protein [Haemophilus haemolyticus]
MKNLIFTLVAFTPFFVFAENNVQLNENELEDNVSSVVYELDDNGNFARLRAGSEMDLDIGDRKDIRISTKKAELEAKAKIAKFLSERVNSDEVVEQIENKLTETQGNQKTVNRKNIENITTTMHNSAESILRGVIVTKVDVNKGEKYVFVEVGYSNKTQRIADGINDNLSNGIGNTQTINGSSTIDNGTGRDVKKIKNYDNF